MLTEIKSACIRRENQRGCISIQLPSLLGDYDVDKGLPTWVGS